MVDQLSNPSGGMSLAQSLKTVRELQQQKRLEEARALVHQVLRRLPAQAEALHLAGMTELMAGRPGDAWPLLERAGLAEPENPVHYRAMGVALKALGREADALRVTEKAISLMAAAPPRIDVNQVNRQSASHHLQGRPANHTHFRKSKSLDALQQVFLDSPHQDDLARFYFLVDNVARTLARGVPGALAELGVWRGHSAKVLHAVSPGRMLYLFDTFTGFVADEIDPKDSRSRLYGDTSLETVRAFVGNDRVEWRPGEFPDSAKDLPEDLRFCLVHIDANLKAPVAAGLEVFYPRLNPGGLLIIHDYANDAWPGVGAAVDAFLADKPEALVLIPDRDGTAVLVKS